MSSNDMQLENQTNNQTLLPCSTCSFLPLPDFLPGLPSNTLNMPILPNLLLADIQVTLNLTLVLGFNLDIKRNPATNEKNAYKCHSR